MNKENKLLTTPHIPHNSPLKVECGLIKTNGRFAKEKLIDVTPGILEVWLCLKRYDLPHFKIGRLMKLGGEYETFISLLST